MNWTHFGIVTSAIIFSAFFSGMEIAFISVDKLRIELSSKNPGIRNRILGGFMKKPSWFISTTLIGNNIALVVYVIFMAYLLVPVIDYLLKGSVIQYDWVELFIQTILATIVVLLTAEFTPKSLFLINPYGTLKFFSIPFFVIFVLLFIPVWIIVVLSRFTIVHLLKLEFSEEKPAFGLIDLNHFLKSNMSETKDPIEQEVDTKIFTNAIE